MLLCIWRRKVCTEFNTYKVTPTKKSYSPFTLPKEQEISCKGGSPVKSVPFVSIDEQIFSRVHSQICIWHKNKWKVAVSTIKTSVLLTFINSVFTTDKELIGYCEELILTSYEMMPSFREVVYSVCSSLLMGPREWSPSLSSEQKQIFLFEHEFMRLWLIFNSSWTG